MAIVRPFSSAGPAPVPIDLESLPQAGSRLRARRRWLDFAPYVAAVNVSYDPVVAGVTGTMELWRMASGSGSRKAYPKYTVGMQEFEDGRAATVEVTYHDNQKQVSHPIGHPAGAQGWSQTRG